LKKNRNKRRKNNNFKQIDGFLSIENCQKVKKNNQNSSLQEPRAEPKQKVRNLTKKVWFLSKFATK